MLLIPPFFRPQNHRPAPIIGVMIGLAAGTMLPLLSGDRDRASGFTLGSRADAAEAHQLEQSAQTWLIVGREAFAQGHYTEAVEAFSQAIAHQPDLALAYYNRGVANFVLQNYDAALLDYNRTIAIAPDHTQAYVNRGNLHSQNGRTDDALADYTTAIELDPTTIEAHYNLALTHATLSHWDAAREGYDRTLELLPENSSRAIPVYLNRGSLNLETGNPQAALDDSLAVLAIDPENAPAHGNLGFAYVMLGDLDRAKTAFNSAAVLFEAEGFRSDAARVRALIEALSAPPSL